MFFACGIWCVADVSSVSPSSDQTFVDQTRIQLTHPRRKNSFFQNCLDFDAENTSTFTQHIFEKKYNNILF